MNNSNKTNRYQENLLDKKVAVVTGSANGIGRAVAYSLAKKGATVYCLDIDDSENITTAETASQIKGKRCYSLHCDISKAEQIEKTFTRILTDHKQIDILINNAAVFSTISFVNDSYEKALNDYDFNMTTNARGTFLCSKMVAPNMAENRSGHIINVNTNHLKRYIYSVSKNEHSYDASKYAQASINQSLAKELFEYGVRVNAICPASTRTPMLNNFFSHKDLPLTAERIGKATSVASLLEPEEVAEAICGMIFWPYDAPVGREYLVIHSEDCVRISEGPVDELAR